MQFPPQNPRQWAEYAVFSALTFLKAGTDKTQVAGLIFEAIDRLNWDETRGLLPDADDTARRIKEMLKLELPNLDVWAQLVVEKVLPPKAGLPLLVQINYTNYRGETSTRVIRPRDFYRGSTEHHPEEQYLLLADDTEKGERTFAVKDIHSWQPYVSTPTKGLD